ncbi:MAG: hypothetical protein EOP09_02890 [Proteobacteria bacterium]|nr:MAG: hypothetical protein EOP09_02890 [Pseudomonadota bacterium]
MKTLFTAFVLALGFSTAQAAEMSAPVLICQGADPQTVAQGEDGRFQVRVRKFLNMPEYGQVEVMACVSGDQADVVPEHRGFLTVTTGARFEKNVTVFEGKLVTRVGRSDVSLNVANWTSGVTGFIGATYKQGTTTYSMLCQEYAFPNKEKFPENCF